MCNNSENIITSKFHTGRCSRTEKCNKGGKYHNKLLTSSIKWYTAEKVRRDEKTYEIDQSSPVNERWEIIFSNSQI